MLSRVLPSLLALADACETTNPVETAGWVTDEWSLSERARERLLAAYRQALVPPGSEPAVRRLIQDGVDLWSKVRPKVPQHELVIRADLAEFAAAAALLHAGEIQVATLDLANVPKGSARASEHGFDAASLVLDPDGRLDELSARDVLIVGSTKHTLTDVRSLVDALRDSISDAMWTADEVFAQFRLYYGFLETASVVGREKLWLIFAELPDLSHVRLIGTAVVDRDGLDALRGLTQSLPPNRTTRGLRRIGIRDLAGIHRDIDDGS